jgi:hypothetical protein
LNRYFWRTNYRHFLLALAWLLRQRVNTFRICPTPGTGFPIRVITKLPNTEQSSKGKGKTYKSTNRQNQSTT